MFDPNLNIQIKCGNCKFYFFFFTVSVYANINQKQASLFFCHSNFLNVLLTWLTQKVFLTQTVFYISILSLHVLNTQTSIVIHEKKSQFVSQKEVGRRYMCVHVKLS